MNDDKAPPMKFKLLSGDDGPAPMSNEKPLVSIVLFVRNRAETICRAIESILNQDYPNIQLVVQDGASIDGTLEILKSYGSRIDLVSEPDAGVHDGFWRALQRVKGEIIGTCLSDEQMMPGAIKRGVDELMAAPRAGAITGDAYMSEYSGHVFTTWTGQDFDFLAYLVGDYCPHFSASFFRRSALEEVGLFDSPWREGRKEPVEFEIWCRLGTQHIVKYVPHFFYKFGYDPGQLSHSIPRIVEELDRRTMIIDTYLFGKDNFFGENKELRDYILRRQHEILVNHLNCNNDPESAIRIETRMHEVLGLDLPPELSSVVNSIKGGNLSLLKKIARDAAARFAKRLADNIQRSFPNFIRKRLTDDRKKYIRRYAMEIYYRLKGIPSSHLLLNPRGLAPSVDAGDTFLGRLYEYTATRYRARGLLPQALQMYRKAEVLNDETVDAAACQLAITSPDYTDADLETMYRRWSEKHAAPVHHIVHGRFKKYKPKKPIMIGYHCIFWGSACADALALSYIAKHDRENFRIIGYSPFEESPWVQEHFDVFHGATQRYDNEDFANLVRSDEVDIFIELSGLSHYHRYGAMALRCAPVQVNYVNHLATTQVANVDYVIGDDITFPTTSDPYYSESIYRLPSCFLTYNYDSMSMPEVAASPCIENGHVTFGSFGGPYKLNHECLELWAAVLRAVPNSRFLMQNEGMSTQSNIDFIKGQFKKYGVDPERLIILPGTDRDTNLLNYAKMDISLDSWPYCGGNSIAEALWQGVPVVTLRGPRATASYGASLVSAAGLPDLAAETPEEYVDIAARLAADKKRLANLRDNLRIMVRENDLADVERVVRALEAAFIDMLERKFGPLPEDKAPVPLPVKEEEVAKTGTEKSANVPAKKSSRSRSTRRGTAKKARKSAQPAGTKDGD